MSLELWVGIAAIAGVIGTFVKDFLLSPHKNLIERLEKIEAKQTQMQITDAAQEVKITTIWNAFTASGKGKASDKGLGEMNSPLKVTDKGRCIFAKYDSLIKRMQDYYRETGVTKLAVDFEMDFARLFGDEILKEVCVPNNLEYSAALAVALAIAREGNVCVVDEKGRIVPEAESVKAQDTVKREP
jgi:hypothetical protein